MSEENRAAKRTSELHRVPYFNPHSFRNTLVRLGYEVCRGDMKALKVWSQKLGHEQMLTTYLGYGTISPVEHAEIMKGLGAAHFEKAGSGDRTEKVALLKRILELEEKG